MNKHSSILADWHIDPTWTLFLDRDGVINRKVTGGYVAKWEEFQFLPGVLDAMEELSMHFGYIIVVTNQQGIGKGLMTTEELETIHHQMKMEVEGHGGRIDAIYHSPYLESDNHSWRKPGTGMAVEARRDFPAIDFANSIMIGDSQTDVLFGNQLGMKTVIIGNNPTEIEPDLRLDNLVDFAQLLPQLSLKS
jgi:histidinol-phosphate phosphatase family protein